MQSIDNEPPIDFLGIGAQKAATSWLAEQLRGHPRFWLPPRKELHYFDRDPSYPSPVHLAAPTLWSRIRLADPRKDIRRLKHPRDVPWLLRYHLMPVNDAWYRSLFRAGRGRIRGEITPAYSMLDPHDVRHVKRLAPDLRIILILRNPIDRAWSQYCFLHGGSAAACHQDEAAIKAFVDSPVQCRRSDYLRTLEIWGSQFDAGRIHVGFYDDIRDDPGSALERILGFLGERSMVAADQASLQRRVNASTPVEMPAAIRVHLARKYREPLRELGVLLGGHASRWAAEAEAVLEG